MARPSTISENVVSTRNAMRVATPVYDLEKELALRFATGFHAGKSDSARDVVETAEIFYNYLKGVREVVKEVLDN